MTLNHMLEEVSLLEGEKRKILGTEIIEGIWFEQCFIIKIEKLPRR